MCKRNASNGAPGEVQFDDQSFEVDFGHWLELAKLIFVVTLKTMGG